MRMPHPYIFFTVFIVAGLTLIYTRYFHHLPDDVESVVRLSAALIVVCCIGLKIAESKQRIKSYRPVIKPRAGWEDSDRFKALSKFYKFQLVTAEQNLIHLGKSGSTLQKFKLDELTHLLHYPVGNKKVSLILGEIKEGISFDANLTEKIIHLNNAINYTNASIEIYRISDADTSSLLRILIDSAFLEQAFIYCAQKAALNNDNKKTRSEKISELEKNFMALVPNFTRQMSIRIMSLHGKIDQNDLKARLSQIAFKDFSWVEHEYTSEGRIINNYPLPEEYAKQMLNWAAAHQAEEIVNRTQVKESGA